MKKRYAQYLKKVIFVSMKTTDMAKRKHHGLNIKHMREALGLKQETLADALGEEWSQKRISLLENKEEIEDSLLEVLAKALGTDVEAIKNYDHEKVKYFIQHNHEGANPGQGQIIQSVGTNSPIYNPIDKWLEAIEENKRLYEALLNSEREKVALLERMLAEIKK